ncbi:MAG: hypothetical protein IJQ77_02225 [Synergistaceae bacterium]|nr:hypothetical protein [Synergistaceae bacterium]
MSEFSERWQNIDNEKSYTQKFWLSLIRDILGHDYPEQYIQFEKKIKLSHMSYIDAYIPSTGIIIEQKAPDVNLDVPAKQSDGTMATPFQQAKRYYNELPYSMKGKYIIVCNFREFRIHDMEHPDGKPNVIMLEDIEAKKDSLAFLVKPDRDYRLEEKISEEAGNLAFKLRNELLKRYINPKDEDSLRHLNIFCVRIVFLLYAEDCGLFRKSQFHDYLKARVKTARQSLMELFKVLDQEKENRDPYLDDDLKDFPYVNGGLFHENKDIVIPQLDGEPIRIILEDMSEGFNWSGISPTIFGSIFERILQTTKRHSGGIHYTSVQNIHRVINPLFLDKLNADLEDILTSQYAQDNEPAMNPDESDGQNSKQGKSKGRKKKQNEPEDKITRLNEFRRKLTHMKFFDPACGSGNFLTETYLSLCRLEKRVINELGELPFLQVSIEQFYGIEIHDFAVDVARTALWISMIQMFKEVNPNDKPDEKLLPLRTKAHIKEGNALLMDWNAIVKPDDTLYIISNPPFLGYSNQTSKQKEEVKHVFGDDFDKAGKLDYVAGWYYKASEFMQGNATHAAFVSTNSICQGEQTCYVWKPLIRKFGMHIDFAHQEFKWYNEAKEQAQVQVIVVGISHADEPGTPRRIYDSEGVSYCRNINAYLIAGPYVFAEARDECISENAPLMRAGGKPTDGGHLIMTLEEYHELIEAYPIADKLIRPFMMGRDFIHRVPRYCLWLVDADPGIIKKCPPVMERIKAVKEYRLQSQKAATRRKAETPALFDEIKECKTNYIAIPVVSSAKRKYIPIDWLPPEIIPGNKLFTIENASLYHFGVLTSRVHMGWMRRVAGRLRVDYSYSNTIVYNCFSWPDVNSRQKARIESTAQEILDARAKFPDTPFSALYDDMIMPPELRRAHERNDEAVCAAYGWQRDIAEEDIVMNLFRRYYAAIGDTIEEYEEI